MDCIISWNTFGRKNVGYLNAISIGAKIIFNFDEEKDLFLSEEDQIEMSLPFVDHLPWNTFGRNNVGYLFAISMDAKVTFDFDDDNLLKFLLKGASPNPVLDTDHFSVKNGFLKCALKLTDATCTSEFGDP